MSDFECLRCEHHKNRAARWRAEASKQAGHDKIELPWVGLTDDAVTQAMYRADAIITGPMQFRFAKEIEAKLKEKNT